ncbi:helix-turn-helix transcriptional regulator [Nocardia sp. NPDC004722]
MPTAASTSTSARLLSLLSLLQVRRDWPGGLLAERLDVSERTVRRDVDRLRELGYPVRAIKGPEGGYRLVAGSELPPLLFDDEQAVALAVALRLAVGAGAGIEEAADRALATVRQVLPARLRRRVDALEVTAVESTGGDQQADTEVLLALSAAIRATEQVRFDYRPPGSAQDTAPRPPRLLEPHHLVARQGRWYLLGWEAHQADWRIYRVDRLSLRVPNGPRFTPRELPGGDPARFLATRFKGSETADTWPCRGEVILHLPATRVAPFAADGFLEELSPTRTRLITGSWSWPALAATLARFDTEIEVIGPDSLREAFTELSHRARRAAGHD